MFQSLSHHQADHVIPCFSPASLSAFCGGDGVGGVNGARGALVDAAGAAGAAGAALGTAGASVTKTKSGTSKAVAPSRVSCDAASVF